MSTPVYMLFVAVCFVIGVYMGVWAAERDRRQKRIDSALHERKLMQESLEEGQISKEHAAMALKYILEDIEARELTIMNEFSGNDGAKTVITASYEAGV
ncbi:hypothetical protein [Cloacibacillus sp. An23]|uniref:hypothetical protein n=1 Tax=Cloacibacillus sp. An23 TaxID=1965591 RepID=UPI000B377A1F|nr:hypothetical protein [Cloacibacillus sp. An23]OUO92592.1 hypothetical protein B5F39_10560 [Cloacibacillus sp. An23]